MFKKVKKYLVMLGLVLPGSLVISWQNLWVNEPYPLHYPHNFGSRFDIPANNPTTKAGVFLGRMLFYEPRLSATNKISCASCHKQELAFADNKARSQGINGISTQRNAMSLANLLWVRQFFWDGRAKMLEAQAVSPLTSAGEMGQSLSVSVKKLGQVAGYALLFKNAFGTGISEEGILMALAQFERTLISSQSVYDKYLSGNYQPGRSELNGMKLFETPADPEKGIRGGGCGHCHGGAKMYKELFHNNGLDSSFATDRGRFEVTNNQADIGRFRVVTLRNIALTAPYMHDGRFKTLAEVLDHYSDHVKESSTRSVFLGPSNTGSSTQLSLTAGEKADIIAFLHMLTDSAFITNPRFSNPHRSH